jgi:hypothetical protein
VIKNKQKNKIEMQKKTVTSPRSLNDPRRDFGSLLVAGQSSSISINHRADEDAEGLDKTFAGTSVLDTSVYGYLASDG